MDERNFGAAHKPSSGALARFDAPRRGGRSSPPPPAVQAEALVQSFNSWAFKREQPDNAEKLNRLGRPRHPYEAAAGVCALLGTWTAGGCRRAGAALSRIPEALTGRVKARHAPGAEMTLICTDTHADSTAISGSRRDDISRR